MTYTDVKKDANSVSVLCGISDLDGSVMPIQIDPVTGAVLIVITKVSDETSTLSPGWAQKDSNSSATMLGQADDASGLLVPSADRRNSLLWVDIL